MKLLTNNLLGMVVPFFLNNSEKERSYYLYQIFSPGLSPNTIPWVSLRKVKEKTNQDKGEPGGAGDSDVLAWAIGLNGGKVKVFPERGLKWLRNNFKFLPEVQFEGIKFPSIEIDQYSQGVQKNLIVSLRDSIRFSRYKLESGMEIDALYSPDYYLTFGITNNSGTITLTPKNFYHVSDVEMKNPLPIPTRLNLKKNHPSLFREFKEMDNKKCPGICRAIKEFEWDWTERKNPYENETKEIYDFIPNVD